MPRRGHRREQTVKSVTLGKSRAAQAGERRN